MTTLNLQVVASADDDQVSRPTAWWTNSYAYFAAGHTGSVDWKQYGASARFTGVDIPSGATVDLANLTLRCGTATSGNTVRTDICCENAQNPGQVANYADHVGRTRTAAVPWDSIPAWTLNVDYESPGLASCVQTVVDDQSGTGSALIVFWEDRLDESDSGAYRAAYAHDTSETYAPKLDIDYTAGGVPVVVDAVSATAPAAALIPIVTAQKNVSVSAVAGSADTVALLPTIVTAKDVVVDGEIAEVTAEAPLPTVKISRVIPGELATTTAEALLPVIGISKVVSAEVAEAPAAALLPTITTQQQVAISAEIAEATAEALLPEILIGGDALVVAEPATTVADALLPTIETGVKVSGEPAAAPADVPVPTIRTSVSVDAVVATAVAEALLPEIITGLDALVDAQPAIADAAALNPTITTVRVVSIDAAVAIATSEALLPVIRIGKSVPAEAAIVDAAALAPTITTIWNVLALAVSAIADAAAPVPTVTTGEVDITPVVPGSAFAMGVAALPHATGDVSLEVPSAKVLATYIQKITASDLSPFEEYTRVISEGVGTDTFLQHDVPGDGTSRGGFLTPAEVPYSNAWEDGDVWTFELEVVAGSGDIFGRARCVRVGSGGEIRQVSDWTAEQGPLFTANYIFNPVAPTWFGTESIHDRLGVELELRNTAATGRWLFIGVGTVANEVVADVVQGPPLVGPSGRATSPAPLATGKART